jgi:SpoVK/Ycf46/Vps4 family AAA+-type ATPase
MVEDEFDRILQWISPLGPHKRHEDIKSKRMKGIGSWFLKRDEFKAWYHADGDSDGNSNRVLACYGIPGAGKSLMRSVVFNLLDLLSLRVVDASE